MGSLVAQQTTATAIDEHLTTLIDWVNVRQFSAFRWVVENTGGGTGNDITDVQIDESDNGGTTVTTDQVDGSSRVPIAAAGAAQLNFTSTAKYLRVRAVCGAGNDTTAKGWLLADTVTGLLCTLSDVRTRKGYETTDTSDDEAIYDIIRGVSAMFDIECNRTLLLPSAAQTLTMNGRDGDTLISPYYPIVSVTSIKETTDYDFDNTDALTENTDYRVIASQGILHRLNTVWLRGIDNIQVVVKGGYVPPSETVGTGETALPDEIREAAIQQSLFFLQRRSDIGLISVSAIGSSISKHSKLELLPFVRSILNKHRRYP